MTLLLAFMLMLLIVGGMAVGVMFGRKPIAGSCGGMKALGMNTQCEVCGGDPNRCERDPAGSDPDGLGRDATRTRRTL
jgi:uncharacterized protein